MQPLESVLQERIERQARPTHGGGALERRQVVANVEACVCAGWPEAGPVGRTTLRSQGAQRCAAARHGVPKRRDDGAEGSTSTGGQPSL